MNGSQDKVVLRLNGQMIGFKNSKMLTRGKLITNPKLKEKCDKFILDLQSQLRAAFQTIDAATLMDAPPPCLIALREHSKDFDDSWQWLPEIHIKGESCEKGCEETVIEIKQLP